MKISKIVGAVKAVKNIAESDNPGAAVGKLAAGAAAVAHPIIGGALAKPIAKGVEKAVNKGIEVAKDPEVKQQVRGRVAHLHDAIKNARR